MLTQIEWWGGVIFVLWAAAYRLMMGSMEKDDEGIAWHRGFMHAFFLLPAVVLAAYFYPLQAPWQQYSYLAVLAASLLVVAAMLVREFMGEAAHSAAAHQQATATGTTRGEGGEEKEKEGEEEESGWLAMALGMLVLYSPVFVACGLGCYKAWPLVRALR